MKKIIVCVLLVLSSAAAQANAEMDRQSYCANYATMLKSIAAWRDQGVPSEKALGLIRGVRGISVEDKKEAITAVYFDKSFANSRGKDFSNQTRTNCLAEKLK